MCKRDNKLLCDEYTNSKNKITKLNKDLYDLEAL